MNVNFFLSDIFQHQLPCQETNSRKDNNNEVTVGVTNGHLLSSMELCGLDANTISLESVDLILQEKGQ